MQPLARGDVMRDKERDVLRAMCDPCLTVGEALAAPIVEEVVAHTTRVVTTSDAARESMTRPPDRTMVPLPAGA